MQPVSTSSANLSSLKFHDGTITVVSLPFPGALESVAMVEIVDEQGGCRRLKFLDTLRISGHGLSSQNIIFDIEELNRESIFKRITEFASSLELNTLEEAEEFLRVVKERDLKLFRFEPTIGLELVVVCRAVQVELVE